MCVALWVGGGGAQLTCATHGVVQPVFFAAMATVLAKADAPSEIRQLAGLLIRNSLDATNDVLREARAKRWLDMQPATRTQIKNMVRWVCWVCCCAFPLWKQPRGSEPNA